jgi:MFS transporter, UMF1 family
VCCRILAIKPTELRVAIFSQDALNAGVKKREVFGWAMFDFANSGYTTVVLTAVFATYFAGAVAGKASWANLAWTGALSLSYFIVMLAMPAMGAWADARGKKKFLMMIATVGCVVATAGLGWVQPGDVLLGMALIVVSNVFFQIVEALCAAFLPELARPAALGRVSGWGWSFGYFGGMLALGLCLAYVLTAQARGENASSYVPVTMWITAGLFGAAACVTFALLKERTVRQPGVAGGVWADSFAQLRKTFAQAKSYGDFMTLLVCAVFYQGGVAVAITLAAIYAEQVIGFKTSEVMLLIFVLNLAAAAGAFAFGYVQDRIGHKQALGLTLIGWVLTCVIAALTTTKGAFWGAAAIAGVCMGSSQSSGRAMAGMFAPMAQLAEFYGLWAFATRLASIIGPLMYGLITWVTDGNQRLAIGATSVLFVVGWVILQRVDVARGKAAAERAA